MKDILYWVMLACLLAGFGCDKRNQDNWSDVQGFDFPVNTSHFADYVRTDSTGNVLGNVHYGNGGDTNDWKVFAYHGQDKSAPAMLTGLAMPDYHSYAPAYSSRNSFRNKGDTGKNFDAHGFIYPGVPQTVVIDSFFFNIPFIFKTPSSETVPSTPVIEYKGFPGIPLPCKDSQPIYTYMFGFELSTPNPTDHTPLAVTAPGSDWYAVAYYNNLWHSATPYPSIASGDISWDDIPFADTVKVVFSSGHDPLLPVELGPDYFATITNDYRVQLVWVTESETQVAGYNILRSDNNVLQDAVVINDSLITRGELPPWEQCTYNYYDDTVQPNHSYYYWRQQVNIGYYDYYYGPCYATLPAYNFPSEFSNGIGVYAAYPNPSNGVFTIKHELQDSTLVNILVLNKQCEVVYSGVNNQRFGKHLQQIDISDQPAGLYRVYYWFEKDNQRYYSYGDVLKQ